jgi:subtilisin family serine protease
MSKLDLRLQTHAPLDEAANAQLAALGLRVLARLPGGSYRVRGAGATTLADVVALPFVAAATPFEPVEKLDAALAATTLVLESATRGGAAPAAAALPVRVLVTLDPHGGADGTGAALAAIGQIVSQTARRVVLQVSAQRIGEVAALTGVLQVEVEPDARTQNNVARTLTQLEPVATTLGLDGAGEIVGVADSGIDTGVAATVLADFAGRVVNVRATVNKAAFGVANGADLNNHGTHVCGSIASNGANSNNKIRGMAPAAQLTVLSMGPNSSTSLSVPADLVTGVFADAYADGARIHSNSWGSNNNLGKYTAFSEDVDDFVWNHRDMLVVIAAGNAGPGASTVSAPGTAKNCLTVGAAESVRPLPAIINIDPNIQDGDHNAATPKTNVPLQIANFSQQADNADDIATFSSRGPLNDTGDTRTKPDLVAPGTFILSCRSSVSIADTGPDGLTHTANLNTFYADDSDGVFTHAEAVGNGLPGAPFFGAWNQTTPAAPAGSGALAQQNYFYDSGTSMATPITSGSMAVLRQYLRQRRGHANPSAALLKALAVNAARVPAAAAATPDNTRGFGWLNLQNLLAPAPTGQQSWSDDLQLAVATGDIRQFSVQVADPAQPLRVTLVWTDSPGKGLQNRLYLRLLPPGGGAAIDGDVTAFPNPRNNVQRVHIAAPLAGTYTVQVHGVAVAFGVPALLPALRQDFALAVSNGLGFSPKPVDAVQVIDHSGSMGYYAFMAPARERAKQLVDVLRINDRTGVVQFDHNAATVAAVAPITGLATQTALKAAIDTIVPAGATSIGGGLARGLTELAAGGDASHPQAIVLISDGHENTPPWVGGGVADSPPAWYGGPDFTEVLPTVPAGTKVYTVSLGVASDEVLLQDLANARGGLFQAIHSAAEIGKLHEIYVHLQALVGGEEVIAAGSDVVAGAAGLALEPVPAAAGAAAPPRALGRFPELGLLAAAGAQAAAAAAVTAAGADQVHTVQIDDTVRSAAFVVSWHDAARPVTLRLVSPSLKVITPASAGVLSVQGSSWRLIRIEQPEPGAWALHVQADKAQAPGNHAYTWGVHGSSPIHLALALPKKPLGATQHKLGVNLLDAGKLVSKYGYTGQAAVPKATVDALLKKYAKALQAIQADLKPDTPKISPLLTRLPLLDLQLVAAGKPSLFTATTKRLAFSAKTGASTSAVSTPVPGITGVTIGAAGTTRKGYAFTRVARFDLRT